jgi:hypothetical protein
MKTAVQVRVVAIRVTRTEQAYLAVDQTTRDAYHTRPAGR